MAAIVMPATAHGVPVVMPAMTRPMEATTQAKNRFHLRSPMRSETQPHATILTAPNT